MILPWTKKPLKICNGMLHVSLTSRLSINPLTTTIGRPFFGQKSPAARARELFTPSTDSASLLVNIEKKHFSFSVGVFWK